MEAKLKPASKIDDLMIIVSHLINIAQQCAMMVIMVTANPPGPSR